MDFLFINLYTYALVNIYNLWTFYCVIFQINRKQYIRELCTQVEQIPTLCHFCFRNFQIKFCSYHQIGLHWWLNGKESACNAEDLASFLSQEDPLEKGWLPPPVFFHGES